MKCPKCQYLGFETGNRCKNCGYDFSLLAAPGEGPAPDLMLRPSLGHGADDSGRAGRVAADETIDLPLRSVPATPAAHGDHRVTAPARGAVQSPAPPPYAPRRDVAVAGVTGPVARSSVPAAGRGVTPDGEGVLPLFSPDDDEEPLIVMPAAPRAPVAVRRTPDPIGLKRPPPVRRPELVEARGIAAKREEPPVTVVAGERTPPAPPELVAPSAGLPRLAAALFDVAILLTLDLTVIYFTLRMAGLSMGEWRLLPPVPMLGFLVGLKLAYVAAFTAASGQTIGKMAAQIRVVTEDGRRLGPSQALARTLAAGASVAALGAGFVPALLGGGRLAFHDRVSGTRVVSVRQAG